MSDQQITRAGESKPGATSTAFQVREGVLAVPGELKLHFGGTLESVSIAWRLAGPADAPVVVALGGISASRRVWLPDEPRGGWWHEVVGPGPGTRHAALSHPQLRLSGRQRRLHRSARWRAFPDASRPTTRPKYCCGSSIISASAQLRAIAGASYGGMVALAFGERYPDRVARLIVISAADRAHPMASAWRVVQRRIVKFALESGKPAQGLELARALAMATYRSPEEFAARFAGAARRTDDRLHAAGRGVPVRARCGIRQDLSARVIRVPVRIHRPAPRRRRAHLRAGHGDGGARGSARAAGRHARHGGAPAERRAARDLLGVRPRCLSRKRTGASRRSLPTY